MDLEFSIVSDILFITKHKIDHNFGKNHLRVKWVKPIFHCNFALGIPSCWYFGANANHLIGVLADAKPKIGVLADVKPKRKPVEYRLHWVPTQNSGVGHVHFMFFVLISFALGSQRKPSFQWNMGLRFIYIRQAYKTTSVWTHMNDSVYL